MYLKRHPETYQVVSALLCRVTLTTCLDINSISRFFDGLLALTLVFSLLHRFSVEFKSKLFAGQSTTFSLPEGGSLPGATYALGSFVSEATALSQFCCWLLEFSFKTFTYPSFLIIPSILMRFTAPVTMKHPHSILLPQCFTVGMVFFGLYASPFFKHEQDLFSQELQFPLFWLTYVLPTYIYNLSPGYP